MIEMILQMLVFGLVSPGIALPAFVFGWIVRQWWLVPVGAVVIAAVFVIISMIDFEAPGDSEILWAVVPFSVLPPLAWCAGGFYFGRWRRSRTTESGPLGLGRIATILAGLLLGAVLGAGVGLGLGEAYVTLARVSSFEGLAGYVVVFLFMFPGSLIGAVAGAVTGAIVNRRLSARRSAAA